MIVPYLSVRKSSPIALKNLNLVSVPASYSDLGITRIGSYTVLWQILTYLQRTSLDEKATNSSSLRRTQKPLVLIHRSFADAVYCAASRYYCQLRYLGLQEL